MIREIHNNVLYVGNALDARDLRLLYDSQIRAVVDLAVNEAPAQLGRDHIYLRIPIIDGDGNADAVVETAIRSVVMLAQHGIRTLVACSAGMSRSPAIAAAAIALMTNRVPDDCIRDIIAEGPNDLSPTLWKHVTSVYDKMG